MPRILTLLAAAAALALPMPAMGALIYETRQPQG